MCLLGIVALSYRQTIPAYPNGGGSYIVAKENLGTLPGLVAAASLMIDYVLTVAVSVAAGVQALATLFPIVSPTRDIIAIALALVVVITIVNLRGVRESGSLFALPTYLFIGSALLLIAVGCIKSFFLGHHPIIGHFQYAAATEPLSLFLILKSFAAGCSAMTGVEAISNGIPAFQKPEARNAEITLTWMALILGTLFIGITLMATSYHIEANPAGNPTVIGQIAQQVFTGPLFLLYPVFQLATLLILTLAANTSYADFPRLAFSIGIVFLAALAIVLLIVFKGAPTLLINLYAVGVFTSFTLSQSGMVRHWWRLRRKHKGWLHRLVINGLGAVTTLLVAVVIASTKFLEGAWMVIVLIPLLVGMFLGIHRHYLRVERERTTSLPIQPKDIRHHLILPLAELNLAAKHGLAYARSISPRVTAVHVALDTRKAQVLRTAWHEWQTHLAENERSHLEVVEPAGRSSLRPLLDYVNTIHHQHPGETLAVILPESSEHSLLGSVLHHPAILHLKIALFFRSDIVVTSVKVQQQPGNLPLYPGEIRHRFIVPIAELDRASVGNLAYARSISPRVSAVHVAIEEQDVEKVRSEWGHWQKHLAQEEETHLVVIESPYRSLVRPLLAYIDMVQTQHPEETVTVILHEFVVVHWWDYFLHNQTAFLLKAALLSRPDVVVTDIPLHLRSRSS